MGRRYATTAMNSLFMDQWNITRIKVTRGYDYWFWIMWITFWSFLFIVKVYSWRDVYWCLPVLHVYLSVSRKRPFNTIIRFPEKSTLPYFVKYSELLFRLFSWTWLLSLKRKYRHLNVLLIFLVASWKSWSLPSIIPEKLNPLSANPTKWSNTLKQFVGNLTANCFECVRPFCDIGA